MNIDDYIRWRGEITLRQSPFNEVDNLILTQMVYLNWEGIVTEKSISLEKAWSLYEQKNMQHDEAAGLTDRENTARLAARSLRFKDTAVFHYASEINIQQEKQFSAITYRLPDNTYFVAYEGTDDSLVGWKENLNMSFTLPVPAQKEAAQYLKEVMRKPFAQYRIGGHSKGGNLAVYAAVSVKQSHQIIEVFNNDGPGFTEDFCNQPQYRQLEGKLRTFIPQGSIVGRLMNNPARVEVVKSSTNDIIWQHSVYTWEIDVTRIVRTDKNTNESQFLQEAMNLWNTHLSLEEKMVFLNTIYDTMVDMGFKSFDELFVHKAAILKRLVTKFPDFSEETRDTCLTVLAVFFKSNWTAFNNTYIDQLVKKIMGGNSNENTGSK